MKNFFIMTILILFIFSNSSCSNENKINETNIDDEQGLESHMSGKTTPSITIKNQDEIEGYSLNNFTEDLKSKNLEFEINDGESYFISAPVKVISINDENLEVYMFNDIESMEKSASGISQDGCSNGELRVSWSSMPHFYKKDTIIVQYIGENDVIQDILDDFLGNQFAGNSEDLVTVP